MPDSRSNSRRQKETSTNEWKIRAKVSDSRLSIRSSRTQRVTLDTAELSERAARNLSEKYHSAPSTPRKERPVERTEVSGGRPTDCEGKQRPKLGLRRVVTIADLRGGNAMKNTKRHPGNESDSTVKPRNQRSTTPHSKNYHSALEKERQAVEMQMAALTNEVRELQLERVALDRRKSEVEEEQEQVERRMASTRRHLRRITERLES
ncbi:hypothetical protein R3P38DRAFT_3031435 [Favolaschia claudopus]|uniref:Uncharacterized protein n=1 Tax=Favolaschia claudopus TaxID=2862362 RepID=A0AAW0AES2_9AGAR